MKKIFLIILLFLGFLTFAEENNKQPIPSCYTIRCYKCDEHNKKYPGYGNAGSWAERRYECEIKSKLEHTFIYKCHYGHTLYINTKTGDRK